MSSPGIHSINQAGVRAPRLQEVRFAAGRYVLTSSQVSPFGITMPLISEFMDMHDPVRDKADCELNAFGRLATHFLPILKPAAIPP